MTVAHIVSGQVWRVQPDEPADQAAAALEARGFDVAVLEDDRIGRYVTQADLAAHTGTAGEVGKPILAEHAVEKSMPLSVLINVLADRKYAFVLDQDHIQWVATRSDLQAPAVTVVALAYLIALEKGLAHLVPRYLGPRWFTKLPYDRQEIALEIFHKKKVERAEIGLEECLYFSDWLNLVRCAPLLLDRLGFPSNKKFKAETGSLTDLRNTLAHGGNLLNDCSPENAIDRFARIRSLSSRAWEAVADMPEAWEQYESGVVTITTPAMTISGPDAVWGPPLGATLHFISAWDPDEATRPNDENERAAMLMKQSLDGSGAHLYEAELRPRESTWNLPGLLIEGLTRSEAAERGREYGQQAVLEVSKTSIIIVRCSDGKVVHKPHRRPA